MAQILSVLQAAEEQQRRNQENKKHELPDWSLCPITMEVMADPVLLASDCTCTIDRVAALKWLEDCHRTCPVCSVPLHSNNIRPNASLRDPIEAMLATKSAKPNKNSGTIYEYDIKVEEKEIIAGVVTGELGAKQKRKASLQRRQCLIKMAKAGDAESVSKVTDNYYLGRGDFPQNFKPAFRWAQKAHALEVGRATYYMAMMLLEGKGVAKSEKDGIMYLTLAAARGYSVAASHLGFALAEGDCGLQKNEKEAVYWLQQAIGLDGPSSSAKLKLDQLLKVRLDRAVLDSIRYN